MTRSPTAVTAQHPEWEVYEIEGSGTAAVFRLPPLVLQRRQLVRRRALEIQHRRHPAVHRLGHRHA